MTFASPIHVAARSGDVSGVIAALDEGADGALVRACGYLPIEWPLTATIPVHNRPMTPTLVNNLLYVPNYGDDTLSVIDPNNQKLVDTIELRTDSPRQVVAAAGHLYIMHDRDQPLTVFNLKSRRQMTINCNHPMHLCSPNDRHVYVMDGCESLVNVIDAQKTNCDRHVIRMNTIRTAPDYYCYSLDHSTIAMLYVSDRQRNKLVAIDTVLNNVERMIPVGRSPGVPLHCGNKVYVSDASDNTVTVINVDKYEAVATIAVGVWPSDPVMCGAYVFVSNYESDTVCAIDRVSDKLVSTIQVGDGPSTPLAVRLVLFVSNSHSGTVSVISARSLQVIATILVGGLPVTPVLVGKMLHVPCQEIAVYRPEFGDHFYKSEPVIKVIDVYGLF